MEKTEKIEEIEFSKNEITKLFTSSFSNEHKYIEKNGEKASAALHQMANSTETIHSEKLGKDLTLQCNLVKEKKDADGFVTFGATFYKIQIKDGNKVLGKCSFKLEPYGVHLGFIGLSEDLDESYQGTGLGSIMFNKLENMSSSLGASYIEGKFMPIGKFAKNSKNFYIRHGFNFDVDDFDHAVYVRKELTPLQKLTENSEQKSN